MSYFFNEIANELSWFWVYLFMNIGIVKKKDNSSDKRKLNADGEYDPSSPTSENNDETPAKKVALTSDADSDAKQEAKPASPKKKSLPELEKYWKAVNEDPSDFTGWTYLLQYVDQEVVFLKHSFHFQAFHFCKLKDLMLWNFQKSKICFQILLIVSN